jgi:hypothetical protein
MSRAVAWLVDGMNVIGSRPDGWWRDRTGAMRRLARRLGELDEPVTLVLDGRERPLDAPVGVTVLWAPGPGPDAADRVIAELVEADLHPARWRVVTSDGALAERVRAAGAVVEGAGAFRRRLSDG